ncbi:tail tube GTA-gp10-like protein [Rhodovulum bhavnagarense]|uniref:Tail tube GTA-gp10-like protein n=1 Tax=Rhodovulum bhavnagarense TaxID=992286 RepID=A0A4V2SWD6_9RHOB|nr:gene transfer agent family protein [Rhodovulum bhavnagarense]TCP61926.1 tail tube GTA-gp10-like protein [Rhodovulum bhavnagarense]
MANPHAGEVALLLNGERHVLKLTLGALAELEAALGAETLVELIARFEEGQFATRDMLALVLAGLRGGGWQGSTADLARAEIGGGPVAAAQAAAQLLARSFTVPEAKTHDGL